MSRAALIRTALILAVIAVVEVLCRTGIIDNFTMPPPSRIILDLGGFSSSANFMVRSRPPWATC